MWLVINYYWFYKLKLSLGGVNILCFVVVCRRYVLKGLYFNFEVSWLCFFYGKRDILGGIKLKIWEGKINLLGLLDLYRFKEEGGGEDSGKLEKVGRWDFKF